MLTRIKVDDAAIERVREQGFAMTDVPPEGVMVKLALTGNMSTGGISIDRTFEAHPENVEIAEEAARMVGLDIAGIDFICPDITEPVRETGGAICEVNAAPGFRMHTHPTIGEPQFIAKPVVDMLFPPGATSRIPIVAVTGTNGKTTTSRMISHIFKGMGRKVGMTSTDGVVIDERLVIRADASGPRSARMVLQNPRVDFAVFEVARGGILREGLGYERNDVAVVLNVQPDHLGLRGIDTVEQLADVKAVLVEAVPRDGHAVLNADDPLVREMRRRCSGQVVWFSMEEPGSETRDMIDAHCRRGGKALVLNPSERGEMIVVKHGPREMQLAWTHLLPATFGGRARMNVQNSLAAAAAAFAAGAPLHDIRQGLRSFSTNYYLSPGRLNEVEVNGVNVIVDYCHNAPGMKMLGDFVDRVGDSLESSHELARPSRIGVIATAGDRRDEDMRELGQIAAQHFDVVIVREDVALRGRERGEVAGFVAEGVRDGDGRGLPLQAGRGRPRRDRGRPARDEPRQQGRPGGHLRRQARRGDDRAGELVAAGPGRRRRHRRLPRRGPGLPGRRRTASLSRPASSPASGVQRPTDGTPLTGSPRRADLLAQGLRRVRRPAVLGDPGVDLLALGVAHQPDDVAGPAWATSAARHSTSVSYDGTSVTPTRSAPARISASSSSTVAAAQVAAACARSPSRRCRGRRSRRASRSGRRCGRRRRPARAAGGARGAYAGHDLQQRLQPGLVVGQVDHHRDARRRVNMFIRPGLCSASGRKVAQPLDHDLAVDADRQRGRGRGQGVLDVEAGQAGQRHRHVDELDQRVGVGAGRQDRDPAVDDRGGPAAVVRASRGSPVSPGPGRTPRAGP